MPQMMIETFVSQYFWLLIFFLILNVYMSSKGIPAIAAVLKIRKNGYETTAEENNVTSFLPQFPTELGTISLSSNNNKITGFKKARDNWTNKNS